MPCGERALAAEDCQAGRHEQENKNFLPGHVSRVDELYVQRERGHGAQSGQPAAGEPPRSHKKEGQHCAARQQAEHPHGKNIVAAQADGKNLKPMKGHFDAVGPAGLEIKKGFGYSGAAALPDVAGKAREPRFVAVHKGEAGEKAQVHSAPGQDISAGYNRPQPGGRFGAMRCRHGGPLLSIAFTGLFLRQIIAFLRRLCHNRRVLIFYLLSNKCI